MLRTSEFVPVIDGLAREMNSLYAAYIYGYIYLNKRSDNSFDQSLQSIAKRSGLARSTIAKWVKYLCDKGYLIDLTPDEISQAHTYQVTEKAILEVKITFHKVSNGDRGGIRASGGRVSEAQSPRYPYLGHMHDVHDDDIWVSINDTWQAIGLDLSAINSVAREYNSLNEFAAALGQWLDALDEGHIPADWGYGLIYKKIKAKETPPTRPPTFGDEVKALMAAKTAGELEYWQDRQEKEGESEKEN